jgi:uncharacterized FlaG/YvyC family protein
MAEQGTTNINNNSSTLADLLTRVDQSKTAQIAASKGPASADVARSVSAEKSESPPVIEPKSSNLLGEVSLKFEIDSETHDVTILLLDRTSQRVVRTIPPDEMSKLNPGELLQLFV